MNSAVRPIFNNKKKLLKKEVSESHEQCRRPTGVTHFSIMFGRDKR